MTRDELAAIVMQSNSTTLLARRLREALGIPQPKHEKRPYVRDRSSKKRKYKGAKKLMRQRHGVRL